MAANSRDICKRVPVTIGGVAFTTGLSDRWSFGSDKAQQMNF